MEILPKVANNFLSLTIPQKTPFLMFDWVLNVALQQVVETFDLLLFTTPPGADIIVKAREFY